MKRLATVLAAVGACLLTLSGCGFRGLYSANLPGGADVGSHPYRVVAYFSDVLDLVPQSAVKVNDVAVGRVVAIRLSRPGDRTGDAAHADVLVEFGHCRVAVGFAEIRGDVPVLVGVERQRRLRREIGRG